MSDVAWRAVTLLEISTMLFCGAFLTAAHRDLVPPILWRVGLAFGWVIAATAASVSLNLIVDEPLSIGARLYVALVAPAAVAIAAATVLVFRRR